MHRFSATAKQLSAEEERLKTELKHLERDGSLVAEERKELDDSILEHTADMEKEREAVKYVSTHKSSPIMCCRVCGLTFFFFFDLSISRSVSLLLAARSL